MKISKRQEFSKIREKLDHMIFDYFRYHSKNRFEPKFNLPKKIIIKKTKKFSRLNIFLFKKKERVLNIPLY